MTLHEWLKKQDNDKCAMLYMCYLDNKQTFEYAEHHADDLIEFMKLRSNWIWAIDKREINRIWKLYKSNVVTKDILKENNAKHKPTHT